jgi:hypothetical protein
MPESLQIYRTISGLLLSARVRFHDIRCQATFLWAITGLILEQGIHLGQWSKHRPGFTKQASRERRFSRWMHNHRINVFDLYARLFRYALRDLIGTDIYLALDTSQLFDRFILIRVALVYRGRAIPVCWSIIAGESSTIEYDKYWYVLWRAQTILFEYRRCTLLADRGFVDQKLFALLRDFGWHWRIRLKDSILVQRPGKESTKLSRLLPAKGQALFLHKIWLTKQCFGPVHLALAQVQTDKGVQKWAIASDEPTDVNTFHEYGLRFDIEENFLDDKSGGFQLESSELFDSQALVRLGMIMATATLYLVSTGLTVVSRGLRPLVDAHWKRGLSYFQIGWRWIKFALTNSLTLFDFLAFDPRPDPHRVIASKRFDKPRFAFDAFSTQIA